jgi:alpha-methylacyl-CoA racemase
MATTPLNGLKIVEFGGKGPSQFAGMVLADLGAEVVRLDRVVEPDRIPGYDHRLDFLNRGRRSLAVDVKAEAGRAIIHDLIAASDVVIDPFRPGVLERLSFAPDELLRRNPRLVIARITGWGQDGPAALRAGHDINFIAANGVLSLIGRAGEPPVPPMNLVGDFGGGGALAAIGILAAVLRSRESGRGDILDVSMLDASALLATVVHSLRAMGTWGARGTNLLDTGAPFYEIYRTADDGYLSVGAVEPAFYRNFLKGLDLADDPALADQMNRAAWPDMKERLAARIGERPLAEWEKVFDTLDACVGPVRDMDEALRDPQVAARGVYSEIGGHPQPQPTPRFSAAATSVRWPPPRPGEHTAGVLAELGLEPARIAALMAEKVVGSAD